MKIDSFVISDLTEGQSLTFTAVERHVDRRQFMIKLDNRKVNLYKNDFLYATDIRLRRIAERGSVTFDASVPDTHGRMIVSLIRVYNLELNQKKN